MKKITSILMAAVAALSVSWTVAELDTVEAVESTASESFDGISFNVEVLQTKAVKRVWEDGDKIYVFFDDCPSQTSASNLNFLKLTYKSGSWSQALNQVTTDELKNYLLSRTSGKFDALCSFGGSGDVKASTYPEGKYSVNLGCGLPLTQTQADYTVSGTEVSLKVSLSSPFDDYIQVFVDGLEQSAAKDWRLSVYDAAGTSGLKRYEGPLYSPSAHAFYRHDCGYTPIGKGLNGYAYGTGTAFQGVVTGAPTSLTFKLVANKDPEQPALYYTKTGIQEFKGGMAISIPFSKFEVPCTYRTVLYADGTLIIDEKSTDQEFNEGLHGMVSGEYPAWHDAPAKYNFSSQGAPGQPWAGEREDILSVEFGSDVAPVSMAFWFTQCANIANIDFTNLNTASCTNYNSMFNAAFTNADYEINLDLSSFDVSGANNSKAFQNFLYKATRVKTVNVSGWKVPATVGDCQNMFQSYNGLLTTIYADENTDFSGLLKANSTGMFKNNPRLAGGNGTTVGAVLTAEYARIDTDDAPGYFTLYEGEKKCVLYADGTLVINEKEADRDANVALYGDVDNVYDAIAGTAFAKNGAPWDADRAKIKSVKFGTVIKPTSMVYWFYGCSALCSFDSTNLNTSKCTNLSNTFYGCFQKTEGTLDLSGWDVSSLTAKALQNVFSGAYRLTCIDLTGWKIPAAVTDCQNMFRNTCRLQTIYVSEDNGFSNIATTTDMFYDWPSSESSAVGYAVPCLTGGNGTMWAEENPRDKTYAVVDKPGTPGYFTLKGAVQGAPATSTESWKSGNTNAW